MNDIGNRRRAAVRYGRIAGQYRTTPNVACRALLGRCEALANEMDYAGAGATIAELRRIAARLPLVRRRHFQGWAAERSARMKSMSGDDSGALREYATALRYFEELQDIDGLTVAHTFMSDVLRSRGRYRDAVALLEKVLDDNSLYARTSYKPWPWFYHGTTVAAMGDADVGSAELQRAQLFALTEQNWQAAAWAAVVRACFERSRDLSAAEAALCEAEGLTTSRGGTTLAHFRTLFEHAELARARADFTAVTKQVRSMREWLSSKDVNASYMWAHVAAVEAEAARDSGDSQAAGLLSQVAEQFRDIKAIACVARIRTSLWLIRGGVPPRRLVELCRREGYGFELARLTASPVRHDYYPLHVL